MIQEISLTAQPNRKFKILLNSQEVSLSLYQKADSLYLDLQLGDKILVQGAICLNLVPILQIAQSAFIGNLVFVDTLADTKPHFSGLGTRYLLFYYTENELSLRQKI